VIYPAVKLPLSNTNCLGGWPPSVMTDLVQDIQVSVYGLRLRNDLYCVGCGVKLYTHSLTHGRAPSKFCILDVGRPILAMKESCRMNCKTVHT